MVKESACSAGDLYLIPESGKSPGERNGNRLQYPCLETSMDRGAWQAIVHGVAKSWTWANWATITYSLLWWISWPRIRVMTVKSLHFIVMVFPLSVESNSWGSCSRIEQISDPISTIPPDFMFLFIVDPSWLSISNIAVCTYQSQTPNLSLHLIFF